jgi:ribosomal protein S1
MMVPVEDDRSAQEFMATVTVGDILTGTVAEITPQGAAVLLDGCSGEPCGFIGCLDHTWRASPRSPGALLQAGDRVAAEVIAVDHPRRQVVLSRSATENPRLWAFLKALRRGQRLSGTVAAIETFGVFIDLDDGPKHPTFPGVGFITMPELSWRTFADPSEIVYPGQHVTCEVLAFDTTHGEARLSLRATQADPFLDFARTTRVGQVRHGSVTKLVPFGAFVRVTDGIEGLVPLNELSATPVQTPDQAVQVGDEVVVTITEIDPVRRRLVLSRRR